ncbi:MAG TPA: penicillin-binding protein 1C [Phycisphaerae bacterium]|nr:penicillin-binding protein 1C [Phycisphaerae bacterium]HQL75912.1 penicillin-binding protein 1C [Phycisphaerae bacterium]
MKKRPSNLPAPSAIDNGQRSIVSRLRRWLRRVLLAFGVLIAVGLGVLSFCWHAWPFPIERLEALPASPVVTDCRGDLLLRRVSHDDQWRMSVSLERMSPWLVQATIAAEDRRFRRHRGVDPLAVARAAGQNLLAGRTVSGASTLTMQVCRMMDSRPRSIGAKLIESFRALQLEALWSKGRILEHYLNAAPYGGNVRGVQAASRLFFAKDAADLSLAEAAMLAGLPQSPSRYRPDRHLQAARARQRVVLERMVAAGFISPRQCEQAAAQELQLARRSVVVDAPHAAEMALQRSPGGGRTTLDGEIQQAVQSVLHEHGRNLPAAVVQAAVVIDIEQAAIVALIGSAGPGASQFNAAAAPRSPGSALKPFLYAAAFDAGVLGADTTVYDVPIDRGSWRPDNFTRTFSGPLPAGEALRRSLNVPAILVAQGAGLERCLGVLRACGLDLPADADARAGLSLAVGGLEVSLLELTNAYATLGRGGVTRPPRLLADEARAARSPAARALSAEACRTLDDILSSRRRRPGGMEGLDAASVPWFMWKTGTSAGRRDAWAVGHNGRYAVGVWVGVDRGAGREELVGSQAAEPALAALFALPRLRRTQADPPAPAPLIVRHPLPPPPEAGSELVILSPPAGSTLIALNGQAVIHPQANGRTQDAASTGPALQWFHNGRLLADAKRLEVGVGVHELRCVDPAGRAAAVRFNVR